MRSTTPIIVVFAALFASSSALAGGHYDLSTLLGSNAFKTIKTGGTNFQNSIAMIGDVNGDGFGDFAIANKSDGVDIVFGKKNIGSTGLLDLATATPADGYHLIDQTIDIKIVGAGIVGLGDFNGDGYGDFAISAPRTDLNGFVDVGLVYVIFGAPSYGSNVTIALDQLAATNGMILFGTSTNDYVGSAIGGGGDVNGDGIPDLVVCGGGVDVLGRPDAGLVWVVFGSTSWTPGTIFEIKQLTSAQCSRVIGSGSPAGEFGHSVAIVGDVNQDGLRDVAIGCGPDQGTDEGEAYVVFGTPGGTIVDTANLLAGVGFHVTGALTNDLLGRSVCDAGDFNGDGADDVAFSMPQADGAGSNRGRVALLYGGAGVGATGFVFVQQIGGSAGVNFLGTGDGDFLGNAIAAPGDINDDGFADFLVDAPNADATWGANVGEVDLIYGGASVGNGSDFPVTAIDGVNGMRFPGIEVNSFAGQLLSAGSDVNGDGKPDIIFEAQTGSVGNPSTEVFVILDVEPPLLSCDTPSIPHPTGATHHLYLDARPENAGRTYFILGSVSGTSPGANLGAMTLPLVQDAYFYLLFFNPNVVVVNSLGVLDSLGRAEASLTIPPNFLPPEVWGMNIDHAYLVWDPVEQQVTLVSNPTVLKV